MPARSIRAPRLGLPSVTITVNPLDRPTISLLVWRRGRRLGLNSFRLRRELSRRQQQRVTVQQIT